MFKKFLHCFIAVLFFCSSFVFSSHCMGGSNKGFYERMFEGCLINTALSLSHHNKNKNHLDLMLDYLWIQFFFSPSTNSEKKEEINSHEKIVDFKPRARFLTKLARLDDIYNFTRQETHIKSNSETELAGLAGYRQYLQDQIDNPYTKSIRKMLSNGLLYGSLTTVLAFSSYHFLKQGLNNHASAPNLLGIGTILGICTFFSGWHTKARIEKHLPSHIANRKNEKITYVIRASAWTKSLRDHIKGTNLVLKDA